MDMEVTSRGLIVEEDALNHQRMMCSCRSRQLRIEVVECFVLELMLSYDL